MRHIPTGYNKMINHAQVTVSFLLIVGTGVRQTLKNLEERRVPVDVHAAIFHRTIVVSLVWTQQNLDRTSCAGQVDG